MNNRAGRVGRGSRRFVRTTAFLLSWISIIMCGFDYLIPPSVVGIHCDRSLSCGLIRLKMPRAATPRTIRTSNPTMPIQTVLRSFSS